MSATWPTARLGEILSPHEDWIGVEAGETYRELTVRLWGKGITLRREVAGSELGSTKKNRIRSGAFIMSKIDARHGAYGIVPAELDGAIVSGDFPAFDVAPDLAEIRFLRWLTRTPDFLDACQRASAGTTNRVRLNIGKFLDFQIALPPPSEQRRIADRLDTIAGCAARVREAMDGCDADAVRLCRELILHSKHAAPTPIRELVTLRPPDTTVQANKTYAFAGVYSFGRGVFRSVVKTGAEFSYAKLSQVQAGDFIYPKLMAWEGAFGIVPPECAGCYVSPEFPVFTVDMTHVLPEVLDLYFRTPSVWPEIAGVSAGTNARRRRLQPSTFLGRFFPLPPMDEQHRIRELKLRVDALRAHHTAHRADLDGLLPSVLDRAFKGAL